MKNDFLKEYKKWLLSTQLSDDEKSELEHISNNKLYSAFTNYGTLKINAGNILAGSVTNTGILNLTGGTITNAFGGGESADVTVKANLILNGTNVNIRCGMGNISISGKMKGRSNIDCGMGAIKLDLLGNINDYSYDARVGLGNVKVNNEQKSGAGQQFSSVVKENHFSIACGMGSVNIIIN